MKNKQHTHNDDAATKFTTDLPNWVISDTHFLHTRLAEVYEAKARMSLGADHNDVMIERWQQVVGKTDTILHCGDVVLGNKSLFAEIMAALPGEKYLLDSGNHDKEQQAFYENHGFTVVSDFVSEYRGWKIRFSHYPDDAKEFVRFPRHINVHGHVHSQTRDDRRLINVSVEVIDFTPQLTTRLLDERIAELTA